MSETWDTYFFMFMIIGVFTMLGGMIVFGIVQAAIHYPKEVLFALFYPIVCFGLSALVTYYQYRRHRKEAE